MKNLRNCSTKQKLTIEDEAHIKKIATKAFCTKPVATKTKKRNK